MTTAAARPKRPARPTLALGMAALPEGEADGVELVAVAARVLELEPVCEGVAGAGAVGLGLTSEVEAWLTLDDAEAAIEERADETEADDEAPGALGAAEEPPGAPAPRQLLSELGKTVTGANIMCQQTHKAGTSALTRVCKRTRRVTHLAGDRGASGNVRNPCV
jgi:hypothetical protein